MSGAYCGKRGDITRGKRSALAAAACCALLSFAAGAEDWPGYERDNLHQNASSVDIDPAVLAFQWEHVFSNPVDCLTTNPGFHGSRNLCLVGGDIAVIARHNNTTGAGNRAYVSVLDAATGDIVTCIRTNMGVGPRRDQFGGYGSVFMEAYDTGIGIAVSFWDPTSGIYYMCNGGDGTDQTAYKLLDNAGVFPSAMSSGEWYVWGVPAFEDIRTAYPGLQGADASTATDLGMTDSNWDLPWGNTQGVGSNQCAFFEVPLDGDYIVKPNDSGHIQGSGYVVVHKITGLGARLKNGLSDMSSIEPPAYSPALTWGSWKTFKMWGGCMTTDGKVYFMGPGDDCDGSADLGDTGIFTSVVRDQGLYVGCLSFSYSDLMPNDGYAGPGTEETASPWPELWKYRYLSPNAPTDLNDAESFLEQDGFYRNKAWLLENDTVWAAWKPTQAGNVELIHCGPTGLNDTFDLGVGAGRRGQDIWPHVSYVDLGATEQYVVYYAGNAWYKAHSGASSSSGWDTAPLGDTPLGPAELAVFDADAGALKWTYVLNAADQSGPYPSLPPNEATGYFDRSRMLVAGSHAYVAWVDVTGANAALKVVGFDITSASAPGTPPVPFSCDLGVASAAASKSFVTDLIAADGWLYALITQSNVMDTCEHIWDAQRIVALKGGGVPLEGLLQFSAAGYSVNEDAGSATITVERVGGSTGAVSVSYATSNGTATVGIDYTAASGTLDWAGADASDKTFIVGVTADAVTEGDETIILTLSGATGGAIIGGTNPVVLTVTEGSSGSGGGGCGAGASVIPALALIALAILKRER